MGKGKPVVESVERFHKIVDSCDEPVPFLRVIVRVGRTGPQTAIVAKAVQAACDATDEFLAGTGEQCYAPVSFSGAPEFMRAGNEHIQLTWILANG